MERSPRRTRPASARSQRAHGPASRANGTKRPSQTGKRKSVKAAAQRQARRHGAVNSKNLKRIRPAYQTALMRALFVVGIFGIIAIVGAAALYFQSDNSKYAACEEYRPVVVQACKDCGLDPAWTDCLLAAMVVESGGDKNVKSVLNVKNDLMQAAEGAYGWVVMDGWPEHDIAPETTKGSIYAGVLEFKQNLELWEGYLGAIMPQDVTEIQLVIQGYNFGAEGWLAWCREKHVKAYSVKLAQEYSNTKMPASAKGTPTHAQKWLTAYNAIRSR